MEQRTQQQQQYDTLLVRKWHLGHALPDYLPSPHHGFDAWLGIPYHMSGGSVDGHWCVRDGVPKP